MLKHQGASRTAGTHMAGDAWQGTGTWQQSPNAPEKNLSSPRRLAFSLHICYFSSIFLGGIEIFRKKHRDRSCFAEKGIELQAEMSVAQFLL